MPTKPNEYTSKKGKKTSSPKVDTLSTTKKNIVASGSKKSELSSPPPKSVGLFDEERNKLAKKKTKSRIRGLLSLSIVAYLGYYSLYACGSPFDPHAEKPGICAAIDPIKLDLYALYQSDFVQLNVDPYVSPVTMKATELYHDYGIPAQIKLQGIYLRQGKPALEKGYIQAQQVYNNKVVPIYNKKVLPLYNQKVAPIVNPYIDRAKPYFNQIKPYYYNQVVPFVKQTKERAYAAQAYAQHNWDNMPPSLKEAKDTTKETILYWVDRAENTDLVPILVRMYWTIIDFYQNEFFPVLNRSHVVTRIKLYYYDNVKPYVDQQIVPVLIQVNSRVHLDEILNHLASFLPARPIVVEEPVYTASSINTHVETANEEEFVTPTTKDIPITPVADEVPNKVVKTVTVLSKKSKKTYVAESATPAVPASASTTSVSVTASTTASQKAEATIGYYVTDSEDIMTSQESKVKPYATTTPKVDEEEVVVEEIKVFKEEDAVPHAEKQEAIYCPTCNSAEEELIVAPTNKHVATANTEKHLHALPTDKDVFEVHTDDQKPIPAQPTSPNTDTYDEDVADQIIIQAPIPKTQETQNPSATRREEDIVFSIQTEVPTQSEEDIVFSIQTEAPDVTEKEEDIVFTIQTSAPTPPAAAADIVDEYVEDKLVEEDIENINEAILEEIREEKKIKEEEQVKKEEKIFVPPAIEKEELVLESEKEHVKEEAAKDEPVFVRVEEPVKERVVENEEPIVKVEEPVVLEPKIRVPFTVAADTIKQPVETPVTM